MAHFLYFHDFCIVDVSNYFYNRIMNFGDRIWPIIIFSLLD